MSGANDEESKGLTYKAVKIVGNGSFGIVYEAVEVSSNETVAIKKVLQDRRYKNRELQVMQTLRHPNVVFLKHHFFTRGEKEDEVYLNLVMDFVKDTSYKIIKQYAKQKQKIPMILVKLYSYQLLRGLAYIHSKGICHRDIKPQNLLVDPKSHKLSICDFGSAKIIQPTEENISYICSRYYRAPELIFGARSYTQKIDLWSAGCVIAELLIGKPLFPGDSGVDQLVEIIKLLGTPTKDEMVSMNKNYNEYKFPFVKSNPWGKVFAGVERAAVDFLSRLLRYSPDDRPHPIDLLSDIWFDELKTQNYELPNGSAFPELFDWTDEELASDYGSNLERLKPEWI
jgi:serine/threonine protein kinase